ncbi:hypothetical protein Nepgr_004893 [Nepenthes gracilis]|uniref:PB1 domain-containing protein n=1 Tax=Nepenthes gracilis TaxID=150966 RepID=A0AAD3S2P2_NEPGR|nr:hypothetical protein Nepgr_004893 [Nepenthes gracilis]
MENYACSYPESGDSSPRSRETDFENPLPSWDEQPPVPGSCKVKFMVSYGGRIHPRPHDNQLSYVGGETKILAVDRSIKFSSLLSKLTAFCDAEVSFKYQLPGEDLDALISVTNDDDLEHMMHEYDRQHRGASRPARLRLFLFPLSYSGQQGGFVSGSESKSDRDMFVEALNSGSIQPVGDSAAQSPPPVAKNVDFLFGLDKPVGIPPPPPLISRVRDPIPDPGILVADHGRNDGLDPQIDARIQELNRLQISAQERQALFRPKSDDNLVGGFASDPYVQKLPEKMTPQVMPATIPSSVGVPTTYWPAENNVTGGGFPANIGVEQQQLPVYMIPTPAGVYTGQAGQGYYQVQRITPEVYREQPMYNMMPPISATPPPTVPGALVPQPPKMAGYTEGIGMPGRPVSGAVAATEAGYSQVAYDGVTGRQVYYTAPGWGVVTTPYQGAVATVNTEVRPAGGLTGEGKTAAKVSPTSAPV